MSATPNPPLSAPPVGGAWMPPPSVLPSRVPPSARIFGKLLIICGLVIVMLLALFEVGSVISDREKFRDEAVNSIVASYAGPQRIQGPLLIEPFRSPETVTSVDANGHTVATVKQTDSVYTVFPQQLTIVGQLVPSERRHGDYRVTVYEFRGVISGYFDVPEHGATPSTVMGLPYLALHVDDVRGIVGRPVMQVNGQPLPVVGALKTQAETDSPVQTAVPEGLNLRSLLPAGVLHGGRVEFSLPLTLAGTESFSMVPLASTNRFELTSSWSAPLFAGKFLPRTREIGPQGFHAVWELSSLASASQQQVARAYHEVDAVTTTLSGQIDPYRLADRANKYGILVIMLTFAGFFLFEVIRRLLIHPIQYLLVGFCLTIFFLLLISFSERMSFGAAYVLAAVACLSVLTYYLVFVLKSRGAGLGFGAMLAALYAAIYGLLISEDNALLLGSLLLFALLAAVMIATRRIDWYQRTSAPPADASNAV